MSQKKKKILLTRRWPAAVEQALQHLVGPEVALVTLNTSDKPLSEAQLIAALADYDIIGATVTDQLSAAVFAAQPKPRCQLIANFGVGVNHIDLAAATAQGIAVTNTPGVLTDATAELALTLLLMSARRAAEGERHVRARAWTGWRP
ncbi:MAG: D-glycerate dehydrogenase, partial [Pseudomonadota bacterium]